MSGFLTLRDPQTTAAEHRASFYRSLNRVNSQGGYTCAELEARQDARLADNQRAGVVIDADRLVSETSIVRTETMA